MDEDHFDMLGFGFQEDPPRSDEEEFGAATNDEIRMRWLLMRRKWMKIRRGCQW